MSWIKPSIQLLYPLINTARGMLQSVLAHCSTFCIVNSGRQERLVVHTGVSIAGAAESSRRSYASESNFRVCVPLNSVRVFKMAARWIRRIACVYIERQSKSITVELKNLLCVNDTCYVHIEAVYTRRDKATITNTFVFLCLSASAWSSNIKNGPGNPLD